MKATVKKVSDVKVNVSIVVDAEELALAEQSAAKHLSRDLKVAGFRKGKAPIAVAIKNLNPSELSDHTLNDAISKAVAEAFISNSLQALERPTVEVKKFVPGQSLEFTAEAEILPQVKLGEYKKLKTEAKKVSVDKKEIDEIIERMRTSLATKNDVKREAQDGDETVIDFVGKKDGVAFDGGTASDYSLTLGSKQFIPGFEEGVVGHKVDETFDIAVKFPKDYGNDDLKGADVVFTVTLKAIKEVVLPKVDDEFAAKCGPFKSVDELTGDIKRELTAQKERENNEKQKEDLVTQLIDKSEIPVPEILVKDQMKSIEQDFENNLMRQGMTVDQYIETKKFKSKEDWLEKEVKDAAVKRVKAGLVLAELGKVEKIDASNEELEQQIGTYRQQYGSNPETLKQLETPEVRQDILNRLVTDKTVERLVELNTKSKK